MRPFAADVHTHSIASGHAFGTIRELAAQAAQRELKLLGVTEHAPGIPGTVEPIYFRNLNDAPRTLYGVEMLYGSEVNVLSGGRLSMDLAPLKYLDYAAAGIHTPCYADEGVVNNTDNVIACMADPKIRFITHPDDGRYPLDYPALVQAAKEYGVALEVNNSSLRKPTMRPGCVENYEKMLPLCMEHRIPLIVNSDAHDPDAVGVFTHAIALLERLEVDESLVLNLDLERLKRFLLKAE